MERDRRGEGEILMEKTEKERRKNSGNKTIGFYTDGKNRKRPITPRVGGVKTVIPGVSVHSENYAHAGIDEVQYRMTPVTKDLKRMGVVEIFSTNSRNGFSGRIYRDKNGKVDYGITNNNKDSSLTEGRLPWTGTTDSVDDAKRMINKRLLKYWTFPKFDEIAKKITKEYEKKGYPKEDADQIGRETAIDIYKKKRDKIREMR